MITLTDEHRRAIAASVPAIISEEVWQQIDRILTGFLMMRKSRRSATELKSKRKPYVEIARLMTEAQAIMSLQKASLEPLVAAIEWDEEFAALEKIRRRAEEFHWAYDRDSAPFQRGQNPNRNYLFGNLMDIWRGPLGQKLTYTRNAKGKPSGDLISFLDAVVRPVLGDRTPGASMLSKIIDRERKRLASLLDP